jgi:hypothetical protein
MAHKRLLLVLGVLALTPITVRADAESDVKDVFVEFQAAIKAGDADKIWPLLDTTTQKAVEKTAAALFAEYDKGNATTKAALEKMFGLSAEEIGKLRTTPKLYCKSKRFIGQWHEVPGSTVEKVLLDGDKATVKYKEEDGDKEELKLSKQDSKWKIVLPKVQ